VRVIIAARLSQARTAQTGIDSQDADARAWAERTGHEVIATVADKISGRVAPFERPNLGPWLTDPSKRAQYDGIVVSKLDRLSRGRDWGTRQWAEDHGKVLLVISPELSWPPVPGDTSTPIVWDSLMNIATAEYDNTKARYGRMQKALSDNGFLVGRAPFGYRIVKSGEHKTLEPDPTTAPYVRAMADRYLYGESLRTIASWLESENVPTHTDVKKILEGKATGGAHWQAKVIQQTLRNPTLVGRRVADRKEKLPDGTTRIVRFGGKTLMRVEPILDRDTWQAVQDKLDQKATRQGIAPGSTALLTSIAECAHCGAPMYRNRGTRKRKDGTRNELYYYRCHGKDGKSECRNTVRLEELDQDVQNLIITSYGDREVIETVVIKGHGHEDELAANLQDIRELDPDAPDYDRKLTALRAERGRLQALPTVPDTVEERPTGQTVAEMWRGLSVPERRDYLLKAGLVVVVVGKQETGADFWMHAGPAQLEDAITRKR
jgi:site-specific DNA recombinase